MALRAKQHLDAAISIRAEELIPLILLSDAGAFSSAVGSALSGLLPELESRLLVQAEYPEWREALARVADAEFRNQIHPLRLWEGQLPWVVLTADVNEGDTRALLPDLVGDLARSSFVLPFIKGDLSQAEWAELARRVCDRAPGPVFLLSSGGALVRDDEMLARGVASYVMAAWSSYVAKKDGLWRNALSLTGDGRVFGLGMAFDRPDWRFHGFTWYADALRELAGRWSMKGGSADRPDYPTALALAQDIVPSSNYIAKEEKDGDVGALLMGQKAVSYSFIQSPVIPEFRSARALDPLPMRLQRMRKFREFLLLSERQAVDRLLIRQTRRWQQEVRARMVKSMVFPAEAVGCLRWMRSLMEHWRSYYDTLAATKVRPVKNIRTFEDNCERLKSREARRPVLSSVLLRYLMILIGSCWTVWGTFFWSTRAHPWNDPSMSQILAVTGGGLIVLLFLVLGQFALMQAACVRAEQLTKSDLLAEFLAGVVVQMRQFLLRRVDALQKELTLWMDSLDKVLAWADDLVRGTGVESGTRPGNGNPRFAPGSMATLQTELKPGMVAQVHAALADEMTHDARWPFFEPSVWTKRIEQRIKDEVERQMAAIRYDQCVGSARWTDADRAVLVRDLTQDARKPAFEAPLVEHASVILLASQSWTGSIVGDASIRVSGHALPFIGAVSAVPLMGIEMIKEGV